MNVRPLDRESCSGVVRRGAVELLLSARADSRDFGARDSNQSAAEVGLRRSDTARFESPICHGNHNAARVESYWRALPHCGEAAAVSAGPSSSGRLWASPSVDGRSKPPCRGPLNEPPC